MSSLETRFAKIARAPRLDWGPRGRPSFEHVGLSEGEITDENDRAALELIERVKSGRVDLYQTFFLRKPTALGVLRRRGASGWSFSVHTLQALLARFGEDVIELVVEMASERPVDAIEALSALDDARVATFASEALRAKKKRPAALAWLLRFPETAIIGLLPAAALGKPRAKATKLAIEALGAIDDAESGFVERFARATWGDEAADAWARLRREALAAAEAKNAEPPVMPAFWDAARLPRPVLKSGGVADDEAMRALGESIARGNVAEVRARFEPASLAKLAWAIFEAWLEAGGSFDAKWGLLVVGWLGEDAHAKALVPRIREWASTSGGFARAMLGLDALVAMGTPAALAAIHSMAARARSHGLEHNAHARLEAIARARGVPLEDLEVEIAPALSDAQRVAWLEDAMVEGRRFSREQLALHVIGQEAMRTLAEQLIWGVYEGERLVRAVRIAEDGTLADVHDATYEPSPAARYGVVHPLELSAEERAAWSALALAYELIAPFPQLAREVFSGSLDRYAQATADARALLGLERRGWRRASQDEDGTTTQLVRTIRRASLTLPFAPGLRIGAAQSSGEQTLGAVEAGGTADVIAVSEALRDVASIAVR